MPVLFSSHTSKKVIKYTFGFSLVYAYNCGDCLTSHAIDLINNAIGLMGVERNSSAPARR